MRYGWQIGEEGLEAWMGGLLHALVGAQAAPRSEPRPHPTRLVMLRLRTDRDFASMTGPLSTAPLVINVQTPKF